MAHRLRPAILARAKVPARAGAVLLVLGAVITLSLTSCAERDSAGTSPIEPGDVIGGAGSGPGRYGKPRAIDSDGTNLVVLDRTGRVQIISPIDGHCLAWFQLPDTRTGFPTGVTVAPSPRNDGQPAIWIAETHMARVSVYQMPTNLTRSETVPPTEPTLLARFGSYGNLPGQFIFPSSVCVLTKADGKTVDRVYVSEFGGSDRVSIFKPAAITPESPEGFEFASAFGSEGPPADGQITFQRPQTIKLLPARAGQPDSLIVTDSINHRLGVFDLDGNLLRWLGKPDQFSHPRGVSVLGDGSALVVEFGNNRVQHIDTLSGQTLGLWGHAGRSKGELAEPWAVGIVGREAFIVDALNHRLVRMRLPRSASAATVPTRPWAAGSVSSVGVGAGVHADGGS